MIRSSTLGFQPLLERTLTARNGLVRTSTTVLKARRPILPCSSSHRVVVAAAAVAAVQNEAVLKSPTTVYSHHHYPNRLLGNCGRRQSPFRRYRSHPVVLYMSRHPPSSDTQEYHVRDEECFDEDDEQDDEDDDYVEVENELVSPPALDYTSTQYPKKKSNLDVSDSNDFFNKAEQDAECFNYPKGTPEGFYVVHQYAVPDHGFDLSAIHPEDGGDCPRSIIPEREIMRSNIHSTNMTLPHALMLLDPKEYPSLSRARKACR